jgi:hypothetical protein
MINAILLTIALYITLVKIEMKINNELSHTILNVNLLNVP